MMGKVIVHKTDLVQRMVAFHDSMDEAHENVRWLMENGWTNNLRGMGSVVMSNLREPEVNELKKIHPDLVFHKDDSGRTFLNDGTFIYMTEHERELAPVKKENEDYFKMLNLFSHLDADDEYKKNIFKDAMTIMNAEMKRQGRQSKESILSEFFELMLLKIGEHEKYLESENLDDLNSKQHDLVNGLLNLSSCMNDELFSAGYLEDDSMELKQLRERVTKRWN